MKSSIPFARSLSYVTSAAGTTSRIPHLKLHILRRQRARVCTNRRHCYHTSSIEIPAFVPFESRSVIEEQLEVSEDVVTKSRDLGYGFFDNQTADLQASAHAQTVTAKSLLEDAFPERTLAWLSHHPDGLAFVDNASAEDFAQLFCSVDLNPIIDPFKQSARSSRYILLQRGDFVHHNRSVIRKLRRLFSTIEGLIRRRRSMGHPLNLAVCRHTLKCAATVGDAKAAAMVAEDLVPSAQVEMDLECYNYLMEAKIWNLAFGQAAVNARAVYKRSYEFRSQESRPKALRGYRVSSRDPEPDFTLRGQVLRIFQAITYKGLKPTEETFTNLMLGLAKAADVSGLESILKSVWNIDSSALDKFDEEEVESPTFYDQNHPLRPSSKLLFAIVHAYGINNQHHKAWRILDYTSRSYAMDIPPFVWEELMIWTYANTGHKSATRRLQGQANDPSALKSVELLFQTATDEPHNLEPTAHMLDLMTRSFRERQKRDACLANTYEMRKRNSALVNQLREMISIALAVQQRSSSIICNGMPSKDFFAFRRDFLSTFLQALIQLGCCRRHLMGLLSSATRESVDSERVWPVQILPQIVEDFADYLPKSIHYNVATGLIELDPGPRNLKNQASPWHTLAEASVIWNALSTEDPDAMIQNLVNMPTDISAAVHEQLAIEHYAVWKRMEDAEFFDISADQYQYAAED